MITTVGLVSFAASVVVFGLAMGVEAFRRKRSFRLTSGCEFSQPALPAKTEPKNDD